MNDVPRMSDEHSLRDVAAWLTTPASCGVFLSSFDLTRIARSIGIGVTPLNRRFAVEQLFRSAAIDDSADALLDALTGEVAAHRTAYAECDSPQLQPWIDHCEETLLALEDMRAAWHGARSH